MAKIAMDTPRQLPIIEIRAYKILYTFVTIVHSSSFRHYFDDDLVPICSCVAPTRRFEMEGIW
jgi:hypothetical protein